MANDRGQESQQAGELTDEAVVEALRRGDDAAFAALVNRYHPALVRLARVYVHDGAVAEDVAQDAWMGFLQGLPRFAGRSSLKNWLFSILVNCARASRRKERRTMAFSVVAPDALEPEASVPGSRFHPDGHTWAGHWADPPAAWPEEHALEDELLRFVEDAVADLPVQQRAVVTLRDIEGWSGGEVCAALGITEGNQRVLLHRARSRVRGALERYFAVDQEGTLRDAT